MALQSNFIPSKDILSEVALAATLTSEIIDLTMYTMVSAHAVWANQVGLAGNIELQGSNEKSSTATWEQLAAPTVFAGNGSVMWNLTNTPYRYMRIVITITGGNADFTINCNQKRL